MGTAPQVGATALQMSDYLEIISIQQEEVSHWRSAHDLFYQRSQVARCAIEILRSNREHFMDMPAGSGDGDLSPRSNAAAFELLHELRDAHKKKVMSDMLSSEDGIAFL